MTVVSSVDDATAIVGVSGLKCRSIVTSEAKFRVGPVTRRRDLGAKRSDKGARVDGEARISGWLIPARPGSNSLRAARMRKTPMPYDFEGRTESAEIGIRCTFNRGEDRVVWLRDLDRPDVGLDRLTGHRGEASSVAFSPDGKMLATADYGQKVRLWNPLVTSRPWRELSTAGEFVAFSSSPRRRRGCWRRSSHRCRRRRRRSCCRLG